MEGFYYQVVAHAGSLGAGTGVALLLGLLVVLGGLFHQSEAFERLVGSRVGGRLYLAYGAYAVPSMLVLMEIQRRRGGGVFRFLGLLALVVIVIVIGGLVLIAFLLYRYLRRRR